MWGPIDAIADWLRHTLGVQAQVRLGVVLVLVSVPLLAYAPLTHEPLLIYIMSAGALLIAGLGVLVTAETLDEVASDVEAAADAAERCEACGQPL